MVAFVIISFFIVGFYFLLFLHLHNRNTMTELFLHYVWKYQLFIATDFHTTTGEKIRVVRIGTHNTDAGPDFSNAHIYIGNTLWVGDVEVHIHTRDWNTHKHSENSAFNTVILHVVFEGNEQVYNTHGNPIPTAVLPIADETIQTYKYMKTMPPAKTCMYNLAKINGIYKSQWFDRLVIERFEQKADYIIARHHAETGSWEHTLYHTLAYNFGFKTNAMAFEQLAQSLDIRIIGKHTHNLTQIEALLFGQASLFPPKTTDEYTLLLQKEYEFLQKKYTLTPIPREMWKFARLRPANFPTIRIAQFAKLLQQSRSLCSQILECTNLEMCKKLFSIELEKYWQTHYQLGQESPKHSKKIGETSINLLLINTIIPFLFAYGSYHKKQEICNRALTFLEELPTENNAIIEAWKSCEIQSESAFRSQALLQLSNEYCSQKKCLQCSFGHKILCKKNNQA